MTETTTTPAEPPREAPGSDIPIHPGDFLMGLIVALLAPMFLGVTAGDINLARMAAFETVSDYRTQSHADLVAIAQIIAFGLAALGSLSLSMADDISVSMALRLRGNANALNRSAEQNRRAIGGGHSTPHRPGNEFEHDQDQYEAEVLANLAATRKLITNAQTHDAQTHPVISAATLTTIAIQPLAAPTPAPTPIATPPIAAPTPIATPPIVAPTPIATPPIAKPTPAAPTALASTPTVPKPSDREIQAMWAAAMADVADEFTASLIHLPPVERKMASRRIAALSSCANDLMLGTAATQRFRPGDLDALIRPKTV
ncbi:MAG: hypothetical protein QOF70_4715 [Acetobacteraceae bacterium]|nr:hypothetical protein [Acetobacteraceae bacterium]